MVTVQVERELCNVDINSDGGRDGYDLTMLMLKFNVLTIITTMMPLGSDLWTKCG